MSKSFSMVEKTQPESPEKAFVRIGRIRSKIDVRKDVYLFRNSCALKISTFMA